MPPEAYAPFWTGVPERMDELLEGGRVFGLKDLTTNQAGLNMLAMMGLEEFFTTTRTRNTDMQGAVT